MSTKNNIIRFVKDAWDSLFQDRQFWECRARALWHGQDANNPTKWTVGRTDMYSYLMDGEYVHYAYPPIGKRVMFRGSPRNALRKAVLFAEAKNRGRMNRG